MFPALFAVALAAAVEARITPLSSSGLAETAVAASGNRAAIAVMKDAGASLVVFATNDSGLTWSSTEAPLIAGAVRYAYASDPTMTVLDDGSFGLAYLVVLHPFTGPVFDFMALVYSRSTDGTTWSAPVVITSASAHGAPIADRPSISVDRTRGTLYLVYGDGSNEIVFAKSHDRGATWSTPAVIPPKDRDSFGWIAPLANGTLIMTCQDGDHQTYNARVSIDGGATFGDPQPIGTSAPASFVTAHTHTPSAAMMTLAAWRNNAYAIYPTPQGVFFTRSIDSGTTWSAPLRLGGETGDAVRPTLAVNDSSGDIIASWLDSRDDPSGATLRLYAARSTDSGATFDTPRARAAHSPPRGSTTAPSPAAAPRGINIAPTLLHYRHPRHA